MFNNALKTSLSISSMQTGTFITALLLMAGSLFFKSLPVTLGVLAGGVLASVNFMVLQKVVVRLTSETSQHKGLPAAVALFKFVVLAIAIYACLSSKYIDPIGFVVGLSSVVIALIVMSLGRGVFGIFSRESKG